MKASFTRGGRRPRIESLVTFGLTLIVVTLSGPLQAQDTQFVPFNSFLSSVQAQNVNLIPPGTNVQSAADFAQMRQYILTLYQGVQVSHSFLDDSSTFDCVPINQQPSVRTLGLTSIESPPPAPVGSPDTGSGGAAPGSPAEASQIDPGQTHDQFGNEIGCGAGTIPMRRVTLEEMTQFATVSQFLQKGPDGGGQPIAPGIAPVGPAPVTPSHKYAFMFQNVANWGGNSNINLWSPFVNTALGEVFSLSQEWYVTGSGASQQTAEVGWQNFPAKYGSQKSRLFIFWTANGYRGIGCYNLDCPGFVQVSNVARLGGTFTHYSTIGGTQYEFAAEYYLYRDNWWLAYQGSWLGYYPKSVYNGGQLPRGASLIEFGTEGVGTNIWPAEGSGRFATAGWTFAADQRNLFYVTNPAGTTAWDTLTPSNPSPRCYDTTGPSFSAVRLWGIYFFVGGPGGVGC